jgi:hypothetical protein
MHLDVNLAAIQARVGGTCPPGSAISAVGPDGSVSCEADDTGESFATGPGLVLSGGTLSPDLNVLQSRVGGSCGAGSSIRAIDAAGAVTCETDDGTAYAAGPGLSLNGTTFSVDASTVQTRVGGICPAGQAIREIGAGGTVVCEPDDDTNTLYSAGAGLNLNGTTFSVNTAAVQARVGGTCAAGSSIRSIDPNGQVTCEPDSDTPQTLVCSTESTAQTISAGSAYGFDVSCPSGTVLTGGGWNMTGVGSPFEYWQSSPSAPGTWTCRGWNTHASSQATVTCYARCCRLQ